MRTEALGGTSTQEACPFADRVFVVVSKLTVLSWVPSKRTPPTMRKRPKLKLFITYPAVTRSTRSKLLELPPWAAVWLEHGPETVSNRLRLAAMNALTFSQLIPGPYG